MPLVYMNSWASLAVRAGALAVFGLAVLSGSARAALAATALLLAASAAHPLSVSLRLGGSAAGVLSLAEGMAAFALAGMLALTVAATPGSPRTPPRWPRRSRSGSRRPALRCSSRCRRRRSARRAAPCRPSRSRPSRSPHGSRIAHCACGGHVVRRCARASGTGRWFGRPAGALRLRRRRPGVRRLRRGACARQRSGRERGGREPAGLAQLATLGQHAQHLVRVGGLGQVQVETGLARSPIGLVGPRGMDPRVVRTLHDAFRGALADPTYRKFLETYDLVDAYLPADEYQKLGARLWVDEKRNFDAIGFKGL